MSIIIPFIAWEKSIHIFQVWCRLRINKFLQSPAINQSRFIEYQLIV